MMPIYKAPLEDVNFLLNDVFPIGIRLIFRNTAKSRFNASANFSLSLPGEHDADLQSPPGRRQFPAQRRVSDRNKVDFPEHRKVSLQRLCQLQPVPAGRT